MSRQNVQNSPKSITRTEDTTKLPSDSLGLCEKLGYERRKTWLHLSRFLSQRTQRSCETSKVSSDLAVKANKPDIVVMDKKERKCLLIDIVCPFDTRIS